MEEDGRHLPNTSAGSCSQSPKMPMENGGGESFTEISQRMPETAGVCADSSVQLPNQTVKLEPNFPEMKYNVSEPSEVYFPLSVSGVQQNKDNMHSESLGHGAIDCQDNDPIIKMEPPSPGETSDIDEGPVPVSEPIPSSTFLPPDGSPEDDEGQAIGNPGYPPTLDMSVEEDNLQLSDVAAGSQSLALPMETGSGGSSIKISERFPITAGVRSGSSMLFKKSVKQKQRSHPGADLEMKSSVSEPSEVYFPLMVSDSKPSADTHSDLSVHSTGDSEDNEPMIKTEPLSHDETSDNDEGPVPVSGPIPSSTFVPPGGSVEGDDEEQYQPARIFEAMTEGQLGIIIAGVIHYECNYCKKLFRTKTEQKRHERSHTGEKPFKCSYCDKYFSRSEVRTIHERVHTGEKPFKCYFCDKCFRQSGDKKDHEKIHTGEKPYKCSYCDFSFARTGDRKRHERVHTGEKNHKCSYCDLCFSVPAGRKNHEKMHTGEKTFSCSFCEENFNTTLAKKQHEILHKGGRLFKCDFCEKCFANERNRKRHEGIHIKSPMKL